jgi:hypothetical protein
MVNIELCKHTDDRIVECHVRYWEIKFHFQNIKMARVSFNCIRGKNLACDSRQLHVVMRVMLIISSIRPIAVVTIVIVLRSGILSLLPSPTLSSPLLMDSREQRCTHPILMYDRAALELSFVVAVSSTNSTL